MSKTEIATAILEALRASDPDGVIGENINLARVTLDGKFNLIAVAEALLRAGITKG